MSLNQLNQALLGNYRTVTEVIAAACARAHRDVARVTITAVTKTVAADVVPVLYDVGLRHFAENRLQQAREKFAIQLPGDVTWHFIGRLQSNKVKDVVSRFDVIHSVDSALLAGHISTAAQKLGRTIRCFAQVNVSGEDTKSGISPQEGQEFFRAVSTLQGIEWVGLMTMAPRACDQESVRPVFRKLRELRDELRVDYPSIQELSMGMSEDYAVAVEEGATFVRIGRRLVNTDLSTGESP